MKKVLIITYYWPPSGGAGVQRWLKLSKYLALNKVEVHILSVNPKVASYTSIDESLLKDIHPDIKVHLSDSFEIINYYSKLVGKENVPTAGFSNVNNESLLQKIANTVRSNLFIPDPRVGWNNYAIKKAKSIIKSYNIKNVITTSPPHSTQLIGRALKKLMPINWIVDFRDPWTDIYYYKLLRHSYLSNKINKQFEKSVIEECDSIITVSYGFKNIFKSKSNQEISTKVTVIPNGYDKQDVISVSKNRPLDDEFIICYTGTISNQYNPYELLEALEQCTSKNIKLQLVGSVSNEIKNYLKKLKIQLEIIPTVPHNQINQYQKNADLLILLIPNVHLAEGITPGKLFEYLASGNQTLALGPQKSDVNTILNECNGGKSFDRSNKDDITEFIEHLVLLKKSNKLPEINENVLKKYSRDQQAIQIKKLLQSDSL